MGHPLGVTSYVLLDKLGEGGMGVVYRARQEPLGREVAIKFLTVDPTHKVEFAKRFQREIEVCLRLEHPNIVKLFDAGERDGKLFYVMEYLAGARPLSAVIREDGALPLERAVDITLQLLTALSLCHAHGILHRDVKPANAMLTQGGRAILMDFGLVRDPDATVLTAAGHVVGTPRYLAPEMLRGQEPTQAADLWAMGALFYELLTGRQAFPGEGMMEMTRAILRDEPPPPSSVRQGLSPGVDSIVQGLLTKDPKARTPDARTAMQQLEELLGESGLPAPAPARRTAKPRAIPAPEPRRRAYLVPALLALAAACGLAAWRAGRRPPVPVFAGEPARPVELADARFVVAPRSVRAALETDLPERLELVVTGAGLSLRAAASAPAQVHKLAVDGLTPGTAYRAEVLDGQGRALKVAEVRTPTAFEQATRLRHAIEAVEPLALVRQFTTEYAKAERRHPTADETRAQKDVLSRWQRRIDGALARQATIELATGFAPVKDAVFGAGGLPPEEQRALLEQIHDLEELLDNVRAFGLGTTPVLNQAVPSLVSARYGPVDHSTVTRPTGAAAMLETELKYFPGESMTEGRVRPILSAQDDRRLRGMTDPRMGVIAAEFGGSYRVISDVLAPGGLPRCAEVQAAFDESSPTLGARVLISRTPPGDRTPWQAVAWLRPRVFTRHVAYHTLPPGLLAEGPLYLKVELMFSWPFAILEKQGHEQVHVPWVFFAEPGP